MRRTSVAVVRTIRDGILRSFPRERAVIINADGGSRDGTRELITGLSIEMCNQPPVCMRCERCTQSARRYASTPESGVALRTILAAAELLRAKACIVISPESENIIPEWISSLIRPFIAKDSISYLQRIAGTSSMDS